MDNLKTILVAELNKYVGNGAGSVTFPAFDTLHDTYAIVVVAYPTYQDPADTLIFARMVGDKIIIEEDMTDKKLVDALLQQGVPRDQIVLRYDGEPLPELA